MQQTFLKLKAAGADMTFSGWASTPGQDRQGDIVEPQGALYELPVPLLWAHRHDEPVGAIHQAHATSAGIRVNGKLTEAVPRAREAWALMQDGALALSVGFQALDSEPLPGGGQRFTRWSWHELSLVSVPANPQARLSIGKGLVLGRPDAAAAPAPTSAVGFDAELFGEAVGEAIIRALAPLKQRIEALEAGGTRGLRFVGHFQPVSDYQRGDLVKSGDALYVAIRDVQAGRTHPQRQGSAWEKLT